MGNQVRFKAIMTVCILLFAAVFALAGTSAEETVKALISKWTLLDEVRHGNLTVVPVCAPVLTSSLEVETLDEMIQKGELVIQEVNQSGSVNELVVSNRSKHPVFIMAGEILVGSKQNRILQSDLLVPAGKEGLAVGAFCVEHGRWTYQSKNFYSEQNTAPISVRRKANQSQAQTDVWSEVASNNDTVAADSSTGSLSASYKAPAVQKTKAELTGQFKDLPQRCPTATGVVVLINGKVLAADVFATPRLFSRLWDKLLESYIVEATRRSKEDVPSDVKSAQEFLKLAAAAKVSCTSSPGAGQKVEIQAATITGAGLFNDPGLLHLALFPAGREDRPKPMTPLQRQYPANNSPQQHIQQMDR